MITLIDNFDSFTYNLCHALMRYGHTVSVIRNNDNMAAAIKATKSTHIVIGPGPGNPAQLPQIQDLIATYKDHLPILGVCLGHQCLAAFFGAKIVPAGMPIHGKQEAIFHTGTSLFTGLDNPSLVGRYHSLIVADNLPQELEVLAKTQNGEIMAFCHHALPLFGVQFHPESVLTPEGTKLIKNFLL